MALNPLLAAQTAADTTGVTWDSTQARRHGNDSFLAAAGGLATTETVVIEYESMPGVWSVYFSGGSQFKLTATIPHAVLPAGPRYRFKKDATAGAVGISVSY